MINYFWLLVMCPVMIIGMNPKGMQLEFCAVKRNPKVQNVQQIKGETKCPFCDPVIMTDNYVLKENAEKDVRLMMNKSPYAHVSQCRHLLIMPVSHQEDLFLFSPQIVAAQSEVIHDTSRQLYKKAYTQESFFNCGYRSGQTVDHLHFHFKSYTQLPCSLPERMGRINNATISTVEEAFHQVEQELLEEQYAITQERLLDVQSDVERCVCCKVLNDNNDDKNFVIERFAYNYVCLSHYPFLPGELSVVPYRHVSSIKDLPLNEWAENIALSVALLPKLKEYAQQNIRDCDGGNIYTQSQGNLASEKKKQAYHLHTVVMPRTAVPITPGALDGHSCKLDYDPVDFFAYAKAIIGDIKYSLDRG